jgi:hypothetical protein
LQLSPSTPCDGGMTAFAALTFTVFTAGLFLATWVTAWLDGQHPLAAYFMRPYAATHWARWLWAVPHRFGRKLWFALLMAAWPFSSGTSPTALAVVVFVSLIALLALALWLQPYTQPRDNQLEVACLLLLLYGYFVSVLSGSSVVVDASVAVLQGLLLAYGARRWLRERFGSASGPAASRPRDDLGGQLDTPLIDMAQESEQSEPADGRGAAGESAGRGAV